MATDQNLMSRATETSREAEPLAIMSLVGVSVLFWVTWPVLEIVGRNPIFFLARGSHWIDVLGTAVVLTILVPVGLAAGSAYLWRPAGRAITVLCLALASAGLATRFVNTLGIASRTVWALLVSAITVSILAVFDRSPATRLFLRYLAPAPLIMLIFFFAATPARSALQTDPTGDVTPLEAVNPAPVVLVVFDELPTASLLTSELALNQEWFPGFGRMAEDGVWYRNAATVHQQTDQALPSILTGSVAPNGSVPTQRDHPRSIFTLLGSQYDIVAQESMSQLCPQTCRSFLPPQTTAERWSDLWDDLLVVGGHLLLPPVAADNLPSIDRQWANFGRIAQFDSERTPQDEMLAFVDGVRHDDAPTPFYFLHVMLPHRPWVYLPDGQVGGSSASRTSDGSASESPWETDIALQRHLLQVQNSDRLLSLLLDALDARGLYHDSLVIVTSDHGIAFHNGVSTRAVTAATVHQIGRVPLFIKYPDNVRAGSVDDFNALSIDILPTIADVIGLPELETDGVSLLSDRRPLRESTEVMTPSGAIELGGSLSSLEDTAQAIAARFPNGTPYQLDSGGSSVMLGRPVVELSELSGDHAWVLEDERGSAGLAVLRALSGGPAEDRVVVVAVDGVVRAVGRPFPVRGSWAVEVVIDPSHLAPGAQIQLFEAPWSFD